MTAYRERLQAGHYEAGAQDTDTETEPAPAALPRTHAELDEVALDMGHDWSSEDLTVAEKQAELQDDA